MTMPASCSLKYSRGWSGRGWLEDWKGRSPSAKLEIYTDGGKIPYFDWAAWGFVIPLDHDNEDSPYLWNSEVQEDVTHNGAEVMAAAKALEWVAENHNLVQNQQVEIITDSLKVFVGLDGQIDVWASNDWKVKHGKKKTFAGSRREVSEKEVWVYLYAQKIRLESMGFQVTSKHVPGHSGVYWNVKVDGFVTGRLRNYKNGTTEKWA